MKVLTEPIGKDLRYGGIEYDTDWIKRDCIWCHVALPNRIEVLCGDQRKNINYYEENGNICKKCNADMEKRLKARNRDSFLSSLDLQRKYPLT